MTVPYKILIPTWNSTYFKVVIWKCLHLKVLRLVHCFESCIVHVEIHLYKKLL